MIADIVVFWLAGSRDSPDRASDRRDWWYRGGPAADEEIRARFGTLVPRACARAGIDGLARHAGRRTRPDVDGFVKARLFGEEPS